jgi:hypothetical protein
MALSVPYVAPPRLSRVIFRIEDIGAKRDDDEQATIAQQSTQCWL